MFSDFHLARIDGAQTIAAWEPDEDSQRRLPRARVRRERGTRLQVGRLQPHAVLDRVAAGRACSRSSRRGAWSAAGRGLPMGRADGRRLAIAGSRPSAEELGEAHAETGVGLTSCAGARRPTTSPTGRRDRRPLPRSSRCSGEGGFAVTWKVFDTPARALTRCSSSSSSRCLGGATRGVPGGQQLTTTTAGGSTTSDRQDAALLGLGVRRRPEPDDDGHQPFTWTELRRIAEHVLSALALHPQEGFVHGDVTPCQHRGGQRWQWDQRQAHRLRARGRRSVIGPRLEHPSSPRPKSLERQAAIASSDLFGFAATMALRDARPPWSPASTTGNCRSSTSPRRRPRGLGG